MKREELTNTFVMISNWKHSLFFWLMQKYFSVIRVRCRKTDKYGVSKTNAVSDSFFSRYYDPLHCESSSLSVRNKNSIWSHNRNVPYCRPGHYPHGNDACGWMTASWTILNAHKASTQHSPWCWRNAGPASQTMSQRLASNEWASPRSMPHAEPHFEVAATASFWSSGRSHWNVWLAVSE